MAIGSPHCVVVSAWDCSRCKVIFAWKDHIVIQQYPALSECFSSCESMPIASVPFILPSIFTSHCRDILSSSQQGLLSLLLANIAVVQNPCEDLSSFPAFVHFFCGYYWYTSPCTSLVEIFFTGILQIIATFLAVYGVLMTPLGLPAYEMELFDLCPFLIIYRVDPSLISLGLQPRCLFCS